MNIAFRFFLTLWISLNWFLTLSSAQAVGHQEIFGSRSQSRIQKVIRNGQSRAVTGPVRSHRAGQHGAGALENVNSMYRDGKFEESIGAYMDLISSDPGNPWLHYNLGNAYFKSNRIGRATVSYMRAYRLLPRDTDIRYNLNFVLKRSGEKLVPAGIPAVVHLAYHFLSENELEGLNWLLLWIVLLAACAYVASPRTRPVLKTPLLSAGILWCVLALWLALRSLTAIPGAAVIVAGTAELRNGPGENFSPSATVPEGRIIRILDVREDWNEIGIPKEGIKGWVKSFSIEKI